MPEFGDLGVQRRLGVASVGTDGSVTDTVADERQWRFIARVILQAPRIQIVRMRTTFIR